MVTRRLGWLTSCQAIGMIGAPYRNRTGVFAVRGRRPGPLDEGSLARASEITPIPRRRKRGRPVMAPGTAGRLIEWQAVGDRARLAGARRRFAPGDTHAQAIVQLAGSALSLSRPRRRARRRA